MRRLYVDGLLKKALCLALFSIFVSCNHGGGKENPEVEDLKELTIKTFTINGEDASSKSITFKGESVTIDKVVIAFNEEGTPKYPEEPTKFTFSIPLPITVTKDKPTKLTISTPKTDKYKEWKEEVSIQCTALDILKEKEPIKVHREKVEKGTVVLNTNLKKIEEKDVDFHFMQTEDLPTIKYEGLPMELEAGKTKQFKIFTEETTKYAAYKYVINVKCKAEADLTVPELKKMTIHGKDVDKEKYKVTIPAEHATVTKGNIKIEFKQSDASTDVLCEPETLSIPAGEKRSLKVYVNATAKYGKFEKTIEVTREAKKSLKPSSLTIHHLNALEGNVTIEAESVIKDNVKVEFGVSDAPPFKISPQPFTLNKGETKSLTISTDETEKYSAWSFTVNITRRDENAPKTIDDVIKALKAQSTWVGGRVDSNVVLLTEVAGFAGSTVEWVESSDSDYFNVSGEVHRDIVNVQVELKAKVTWNGESKEVTFSTTVARIKKITEEELGGPNGKIITIWDFSEENVLKRTRDGKATHVWEIKSVDVKKKHLVAQLKKRADDNGNLLDMVDYAKKEAEDIIENVSNQFGDTYIELKKKAVITWQDLKPYVLGFGNNLPTTDEDLFEFAQGQFLSYTGTLAEFNALSDIERTNKVKDDLDKMKEGACGGYGVPKDTPDEQLLEKLKERINRLYILAMERISQELLYSYEITDQYFTARILYDNNKKWCEQVGHYIFRSEDRDIYINLEKASDVEVHIVLRSVKGNDINTFDIVCNVDQSDSFTLKDVVDQVAVLQCSISDAKDGKFMLTTTGEFEGTFQMDFTSSKIEHVR